MQGEGKQTKKVDLHRKRSHKSFQQEHLRASSSAPQDKEREERIEELFHQRSETAQRPSGPHVAAIGFCFAR